MRLKKQNRTVQLFFFAFFLLASVHLGFLASAALATTIYEQKIFNLNASIKKETATQWIIGLTWKAEQFGSCGNSAFMSRVRVYDKEMNLIGSDSGGGYFCVTEADWSGLQFSGTKTISKTQNPYFVEFYVWAYYYNGITQLDWLTLQPSSSLPLKKNPVRFSGAILPI
jgi:hypothetical protein